MALNISIEERTEDVTYFGDIRRGEFFLLNEKLFLKLEEFFIVDEIVTELEYEHDFQHECDIGSDRYNCWLVGSECDYRIIHDNIIVERTDIDMNVRYVI
jgi:hypothetical protein